MARLAAAIGWAWVLLMSLVGPADSAFEWRAAWGSPAPLPTLESRLCSEEPSPRAELAVYQPYGLAAVRFERAVLRGASRGWEVHAGTLRAPAYRETHLGVGWRFRVAAPLRLLVGTRLFHLRAGVEALPPQFALTLVAEVRSSELPLLGFEMGAVDLSPALGGGPSSLARCPVAPLFFARLLLRRGAVGLLLDRVVSPDGDAETTLGLGLDFRPLRLIQLFRAASGEGCFSLACRHRSFEFGVGRTWHPELGWTPWCTLRWFGDAGL